MIDAVLERARTLASRAPRIAASTGAPGRTAGGAMKIRSQRRGTAAALVAASMLGVASAEAPTAAAAARSVSVEGVATVPVTQRRERGRRRPPPTAGRWRRPSADGQGKAEFLAGKAGATLGAVQSIAESGGYDLLHRLLGKRIRGIQRRTAGLRLRTAAERRAARRVRRGRRAFGAPAIKRLHQASAGTSGRRRRRRRAPALHAEHAGFARLTRSAERRRAPQARAHRRSIGVCLECLD